MALYNEVLGESTPDKLFANFNIPVHTQSVTLTAGQGVLKRGTVINTTGKMIATGDESPLGILCDDVDTATDTVGEIYVSGCFNKGALIVADGYELSAENAMILRAAGIYVENIVD